MNTSPTNETLQELYDLIGCDLVELVQLDRGIIMAVDESVFAQGYATTRKGKLKEIKSGFTFLGWGMVSAGTGSVLGGNSSILRKHYTAPKPFCENIKNDVGMRRMYYFLNTCGSEPLIQFYRSLIVFN